jgi:hypothetical protein
MIRMYAAPALPATGHLSGTCLPDVAARAASDLALTGSRL